MKTLVFLALVLSTACGWAAIGETEAQIIKRYGRNFVGMTNLPPDERCLCFITPNSDERGRQVHQFVQFIDHRSAFELERAWPPTVASNFLASFQKGNPVSVAGVLLGSKEHRDSLRKKSH